MHLATEVRGNVVAADTLVEALVTCGEMERLELFVYPWFRNATAAQVQSYRAGKSIAMSVSVNSLSDLVARGLEQYRLTAWFNPLPMTKDGIHLSQRIRKLCGGRVYPITMLTHGLSSHYMLYDYYLRILLEPTYACDSLVCTSRASLEAARKIFMHVEENFNREFGTRIKNACRLDLIPLCVNTVELCPADKTKIRRQLKLPNHAIIILVLGRLSPLKADLLPFMRVFASLIKDNPKRTILWLIAGSEEAGYTGILNEQARNLGISDNIKILLDVSDEAKRLLLQAADIFFGPADSVQESFGLTPIEAMACGLPQVVADWSGYRDTVSHGETGFLIPTYWMNCYRDLEGRGAILPVEFDHLSLGQSVAIDLAEARERLQALVQDDALRREMGRCSRNRAVALYGYDAIVKRYEELWTELAAVAGHLNPKPTSLSFDQPLYYDFFSHYASTPVSDDVQICLTALGKEMADSDRLLPGHPSFLSSLNILNEDIVKLLLRRTESNPVGPPHVSRRRGVRIGDLTQFVAEDIGCHSDYVRRHVMWLMKYGWISPIEARMQEASDRKDSFA